MRRIFVLLCLTAILWVAVHPAASGLAWAILMPVLLFIALLIAFEAIRQPEPTFVPVSPDLPQHAPRAPPQI
jgi:hypothetical protein